MEEGGPNKDCESILLEKVANGNRDAYALIYDDYTDSLFRFILPFVDFNRSDAEEVVQDIFLAIWIKKEKLRTVRNFRSYLFQMAKNHTFEIYRKRRQVHEAQNELSVKSKIESSHQELVFQEYYASAQNIIEKLTPQRKRIFKMRTQMNMELDEIAGALKISKSGVKKQLYEAIRFVKKQMKNEHDIILSYLLLVSFIILILQSQP
ncbi:RNA polymerase sigma factor [Membranihabitans maritimus]|uniref:RNA polymerase sigma factor n=1 Tax=Membranihabitans maritimus TaxID=2904244 RepID=UPI001F013B7F|nr:sigma-70 family RNA polymerase sigma factor [Membranihabitans maritimus]